MYERFTDRARKVMQLADQQARRFRHEYIGTEHILLGLIKEGSGAGASVLKSLDIDFRQIRAEVETLIQIGPEMEARAKLPQTLHSKKVVEHAVGEAQKLSHNYVGTEHLLLGLLRETEGAAAGALLRLGVVLDEVREHVLSLFGHGLEADAEPQKQHADDLPESTVDGLLIRFDAHPIVKEARDKIEELNGRKEQAVINRHFELAASSRDRVDRLKGLLKAVLRVLEDDPDFGVDK